MSTVTSEKTKLGRVRVRRRRFAYVCAHCARGCEESIFSYLTIAAANGALTHHARTQHLALVPYYGD